MKFIVDIALIVLFFASYKFYDIYTAVGITMIAYLLQFVIQSIIQRKIDKVQMGLAGMVLILGSATLLFRNELFFKWKPTVVYWILAAVLYGTYLVTKKTLLQRLGNNAFPLPEKIWVNLNNAWVIFFALLGGLNLIIAYGFSTDVWVHFKLFGLLGLMLVFLVGQGIYVSKYMVKE
jgi:intracellular septation protein